MRGWGGLAALAALLVAGVLVWALLRTPPAPPAPPPESTGEGAGVVVPLPDPPLPGAAGTGVPASPPDPPLPGAAGTGVPTSPPDPPLPGVSGTGARVSRPDPAPPPVHIMGGDRPYFAHARFTPLRDSAGRPAGVLVESVLPGGRVARLGLRAGDLMLAINGERLNDPRTFERAVARAEEIFRTESMLTVKVRRDDEVFSLVTLGAIKTEPVQQ